MLLLSRRAPPIPLRHHKAIPSLLQAPPRALHSSMAQAKAQHTPTGSSTASDLPQPGTYPDKVVGCLLAALCGDALGAAVEGWTAYRVRDVFPNGLTEFEKCRMGRGFYTDDGQMLLALAASLVNNSGACRAPDVATEFAKAFDPNRGYGGSAQQVLAQLQSQLQQGPLPSTLGSELLTEGGSYGNGGAMRVAPLGLAYRNAPLPVLEAALMQTLIPTHHLHPWAIQGALTQALAVAHLSKLQPEDVGSGHASAGHTAASGSTTAAAAAKEADGTADGGSTAAAPAGAEQEGSPAAAAAATGGDGGGGGGAVELLRVLQQQLAGRSEVMCGRLALMEEGLQQLSRAEGGPKQLQTSWQDCFTSPAWHQELSTAAAVAPGEAGGFQIKGTDAAAAAVWALVAHWEGAPEDPIIAAVHYGGDTDTIACMAGALVGARHGSSWLPKQWWSHMEQDAESVTFFDTSAVQALLSQQPSGAETNVVAAAGGDVGGGSAVAQQQQQGQGTAAAAAAGAPAAAGVRGAGQVVRTTLNMGRDGAVILGRLLALLDVRGQ